MRNTRLLRDLVFVFHCFELISHYRFVYADNKVLEIEQDIIRNDLLRIEKRRLILVVVTLYRLIGQVIFRHKVGVRDNEVAYVPLFGQEIRGGCSLRAGREFCLADRRLQLCQQDILGLGTPETLGGITGIS